jgi:hypothetical protein
MYDTTRAFEPALIQINGKPPPKCDQACIRTVERGALGGGTCQAKGVLRVSTASVQETEGAGARDQA